MTVEPFAFVGLVALALLGVTSTVSAVSDAISERIIDRQVRRNLALAAARDAQ